jgi:hypothetical protein
MIHLRSLLLLTIAFTTLATAPLGAMKAELGITNNDQHEDPDCRCIIF